MSKVVELITDLITNNLPYVLIFVVLTVIVPLSIAWIVRKAIDKASENGTFFNLTITVDGRRNHSQEPKIADKNTPRKSGTRQT